MIHLSAIHNLYYGRCVRCISFSRLVLFHEYIDPWYLKGLTELAAKVFLLGIGFILPIGSPFFLLFFSTNKLFTSMLNLHRKPHANIPSNPMDSFFGYFKVEPCTLCMQLMLALLVDLNGFVSPCLLCAVLQPFLGALLF